MMETRKAKNFLLNHTSMYELISMDSTKYLVWKLIFPRIGDGFVTIDKQFDMCSWEKLYNILQRITLQYAVTLQIPASTLNVQCCEFWYRMDIRKIPMDTPSIYKFCDIDINQKLLHDEVLCATVLYDSHETADLRSIEEPSTSTARSASDAMTRVINDDGNSGNSDAMTRKRTYSVSQCSTNSKSATSTRSATQAPTPEKRDSNNSFSSTTGPVGNVADCSTENDFSRSHSDENIFLTYSEDGGSDEEKSTFSEEETAAREKVKIKMNLEMLNELLKDPQYLTEFCYEKDFPNDAGNRTFDIHSMDHKVSYAAFHSPAMLRNIRDHSNCILFFRYSDELLGQFHSLSEMEFEGISDILMVYVNHYSDRVSPFGYILLPERSAAIIDSVIKLVDGWLTANGCASIVTKCIIPPDDDLQRSIAATWTQAKVIGCSLEYQKNIKSFAKQNKRARRHAELTRLASVLCYLPAIHFDKGIKVIQRRVSSEYGEKLVQHLRTEWADRAISIYGEAIVHRSLLVCKRFIDRLILNRFRDNHYRKAHVLKNCWDFLQFLKIESKINAVEMNLDGTKFASTKGTFELNTKRQMERESYIVNTCNNFENNLKTVSLEHAIEQFMVEMLLCL